MIFNKPDKEASTAQGSFIVDLFLENDREKDGLVREWSDSEGEREREAKQRREEEERYLEMFVRCVLHFHVCVTLSATSLMASACKFIPFLLLFVTFHQHLSCRGSSLQIFVF